MNLLQLLLLVMTSKSSIGSIVGKTGLSDKQIKKLMMLAVPLLLKYMTQNASSGSGASALLGALSQHTDKQDMAQQLNHADQKDGGKIISHILGSNQKEVTNELSAQSGLTADQVNQILAIMAPALMSGVSEAASTNSAAQAQNQSSTGSPLNALAGSGIFGSLFGQDKKPAAAQKPAADASLDGTALLAALLKAAK